jgi:hypothetical protein
MVSGARSAMTLVSPDRRSDRWEDSDLGMTRFRRQFEFARVNRTHVSDASIVTLSGKVHLRVPQSPPERFRFLEHLLHEEASHSHARSLRRTFHKERKSNPVYAASKADMKLTTTRATLTES